MVLVFVVPVRHQASVRDWCELERRLDETLQSIAGQQDASWRCVVVANEGAELPALPRQTSVLRVHLPLAAGPAPGADREQVWEAVRADKGARVLAGLVGVQPDEHVMVVDADDWVSRRLAGLVTASPQAPGWWVERGSLYDGGPHVYPVDRFNERCGTSVLVRRDVLAQLGIALDRPPDERLVRRLLGSHRFVVDDCAGTTHPLTALPFAGAVYRVGQGQSASGSRLPEALGDPRRAIRHPRSTWRRVRARRAPDAPWRSEFGVRAPLRVLAAPADQPDDGNPYTGMLYTAVRRVGVQVTPFTRRALLDRPDVVHVHWPEQLVRWPELRTAVTDVLRVIGVLALARRRGAALVWTVHNARPHDSVRPLLQGMYLRAFARHVDHLVLLSAASRGPLLAVHPGLAQVASTVVPHGPFEVRRPTADDRAHARELLELPERATVLLSFGQLRRYKQPVELVRAFHDLPGPDAVLVVAGEPADPALGAELTAEAARDPRVVLRLHRVPAGQVADYQTSADVAVLHYADGSLNSGAALLSLSYARPVVLRDTGAARELGERVGPGWVHVVGAGPMAALHRALEVAGQPPAEGPVLEDPAWSASGQLMVSAFEQAVATRRRVRKIAFNRRLPSGCD